MSEDSAIGLVLSGGGARGAYQIGALRALAEHLQQTGEELGICMGASVGAINCVLLSECLHRGFDNAVVVLDQMWSRRTLANTFSGSLTLSFFRSVKASLMQYLAPGPTSTKFSIFDPTPLRNEIQDRLEAERELQPDGPHSSLQAVGLMATMEGSARKPLLILWSRNGEVSDQQLAGSSFEVFHVKRLRSRHAFASAALPWVFPPVELGLEDEERQMTLVDGGIADNIPIDPAVRLGASKLVVIDTSGKRWWNEALNRPSHSRDPWELDPDPDTHCHLPDEMIYLEPERPFGPVLRDVVGKSTRDRIHALGPVWPLYKLLCYKLGEEMAFETLSYAVVHSDYTRELIARGYSETKTRLIQRTAVD